MTKRTGLCGPVVKDPNRPLSVSTQGVFLDVEPRLANGCSEELDAVNQGGSSEVLVQTAASETFGMVRGHAESRTSVAVVDSAVDYTAKDSIDVLGAALEGVGLLDSRVLMVNEKVLVHRLLGQRLWHYSLKLLFHCY